MAQENGTSDFAAGHVPLNLRIATFLAGIQEAPLDSTRANTDQGSSSSNPPQDGTTRHADPLPSLAIVTAGTSNERPTSGQTSARKRRHRDDRQKLSNSLAQKRYRERKKKAFDNMKTLVDSLQDEVNHLQSFKRENEKLVLEMQEYRRLSAVHGMEKTATSSLGSVSAAPLNDAASPPSFVNALALQNSVTMQLAPTDQPGPQIFSVQNMSGAEWMATLGHICQSQTAMEAVRGSCIQAQIDQLEKDWLDRISAAENILRVYQMYGGPTGTSTEHMLPFLHSCMRSMVSINSDLAALKVQLISQQVQENNERIRRAFGFPDNGSK